MFFWWPKKTPKCSRGSTGSSRFASERTSTSPLLLGLILVTTPRRWGFTMVKRDISWDEALKPDFSLMIFAPFSFGKDAFVRQVPFCQCMVSKYFVCTKL